MNIVSIITGDFIDSKKLIFEEKEKLIKLLESLSRDLSDISKSKTEIFRGDSFQIRVDDPLQSLRFSIALRALVRKNTFVDSNRQWDVRLSLGLGNMEFEKDHIGSSDGEAYRNSGYGLDEMKKNRLNIKVPNPEITRDWQVSTAFADDIISNWTIKQSVAIYQKLISNITHEEIAKKLNVRRQTVDKLLKSAKEPLIEFFIHRFEEYTNQLITKSLQND